MVTAGEIYLVDGIELGLCTDARPCLVLQIFKDTALICAISAQLELAEGHEITLLKSDSEFPASGLKKDSFMPDVPERDVKLSALKKSSFLGRAEGEFKRKVER